MIAKFYFFAEMAFWEQSNFSNYSNSADKFVSSCIRFYFKTEMKSFKNAELYLLKWNSEDHM